MKNLKLSHLFDFGHAIRLAKSGVPVSSVNDDFIGRVTGIEETIQVKSKEIWSKENRRIGALIKGPEGLIDVLPYTTKMTRNGIINYIPTNEDLYSVWMFSDAAARCSSIILEPDTGNYKLEFERFLPDDHLAKHLPFWMLYNQDMIGYHRNAIFIAGKENSNWVNSLIYDQLSNVIDVRDKHDINVVIDTENDDTTTNYQSVVVSPNSWDIDSEIKEITIPTNIFIDIDSLNNVNLLNGENALESVKDFCQRLVEVNPLVNWVSFSLQEEIQNSDSSRESDNDDEASHDESYALKG